MTICGVIAEYDPFHNGHAYQLAQARERSGCDYVVVCMDGGFTQRGDAALLDKWTRTRAALENGADLVVELPALFAVRPADKFALGGVLTLGALGINALSFGCETDDLALLSRVDTAFGNESDALSDALRRRLKDGQSLARARGEAAAEILGVDPSLIASPNVTLALEYMRAARLLSRSVSFVPVLREGGYHDPSLGRYASASAIRSAIAEGRGGWQCALPESSLALLTACLDEGRFARADALDTLLLHTLRTTAADDLAGLCDAVEGMEGLFLREADRCGTRDELLERVKCKRYTYARLNRFCAHALLGLTRADTQVHPIPEYIRVLGFRRDAQPLLKHIKENARLPFITDPVRLKRNSLFRFDCLADDLQALAMNAPAFRTAGHDFTQRIVAVG